MEILRSSEALESQILDDARGKAKRILQEADREAAAVSEEWRRKAESEGKRLDAERDARIAAIRQELEASLPLDFMRARLTYMQDAVSRGLADYFSRLSSADLARTVGTLLRAVPRSFADATLVVTTTGIPPAEARRAVEEGIPGAKVAEVKSGADGALENRGLIVETSDGRMRFRGTVGELTALLLEEHREEIAAALLGKDV